MLGTLHAVRMRSWDARALPAEGDDLPPPRLRSLVVGSPDGEWSVAAGRSSATALRAAAVKRGFDLDDPSTAVLDFGCGCGRTSRHWHRSWRIVVCYPRQEGTNACVRVPLGGSLARLTDDFDEVDRLVEALHRHEIHLLVRRLTSAEASLQSMP